MLVERIGVLEPESEIPLYLQLQSRLRDAIARGVLAAEEALPPERNLSNAFDVSRVTVRKATDGLVDAGLLIRRQGSGTFVSARVQKNFATISSFSEDMRSRGRQPRSQWISRGEFIVSPDEAMALGLSPGSAVFRFARIRFADEESMALGYTAVPVGSLPSLNAVKDSLYEALANRRPVRALQRLRAVLFTPEQCGLLQIAIGDPGLEIERRGFDRNGHKVEFTRSYYRGDTYDFVAECAEAGR